MNKKLLYALPAALLTAGLLIGAGCTATTSDDTTTTNTTKTTKDTIENTNAVDTTTGNSLWTDKVDQGTISDEDMTGILNGETMDVAYVSVQNWGDNYSWSFSNAAPDSVCGVVVDNDAVNFRSMDLQEGTFEKAIEDDVEFDDYSAYYYYEQEDGVPYSMNTDWAATLVVDNIDENASEDAFGNVVGEVTGWADFEFDDGTAVSGAFVAELCDYSS